MGILEVLTIIFVVLKLTSVIDWPWWLVISPMYLAIAIYTIAITMQILMWKKFNKDHRKLGRKFWEDE